MAPLFHFTHYKTMASSQIRPTFHCLPFLSLRRKLTFPSFSLSRRAMASFTCSIPIAPIRASSSSSYGSSKKPGLNLRKPASGSFGSSSWWAPLFGWSSDADYITGSSSAKNPDGLVDKDSGSDSEPCRARSRFALGCFTEEKAKQLRRKTMEASTFHDIMYHSAIASRLATDASGRVSK